MADPSDLINAGEEGCLWGSPASHKIANLDDTERYIRSLPAEHAQSLIALYLDRQHHLVATEILARRTSAATHLKPMRIIQQAQRLGGFGFIIVHYDPARASGPTPEELRLARELRRAGEELNTYLLHYLIIGRGRVREAAG